MIDEESRYEMLKYRRLGDLDIYAIAKLKSKDDEHILWRIRSVYGGEINLTEKWMKELIDFVDESTVAELEAEGTVLSMRYGFLSLEHERLKAERDRLREALQEIVECADDYTHIVAKKALEES